MNQPKKLPSDKPFFYGLGSLMCLYVLLIICLVLANFSVVSWGDMAKVLGDADVQASIRLTFISCSMTAILAVLVAVPSGYLLSRFRFRGRGVIDSILDIPIVLPPL
ncbi:MAG: molybdenum ABC transporter permease, partial [Akkermansiaceae bacterium]